MDREILERVLKNALKEKAVVYIYNDTAQKDEHYGGFVKLVTKDFVVMQVVLSDARSSGYLITRLDTIFRIDSGGHVAKRLELLYALNGEEHAVFELSAFGNLFVNVIKMALQNKIAIAVLLNQDEERETLNGFIRHFADEHVVLEDFDDDAQSYGEIHFELAAILDINIGTRDLHNLTLLYERGFLE
ncbi:hypothetical protein HB943_06870 [Listeria weihenstephanensis]|uniref:Uncharacterized protein n=1 Tax=Listeria weihenstephanensis TaxID=1006155 RepID=A0A841Z374_9LIST|nr:hypothetical protein [Listeria weihenstephanensis]MBC1500321.1 hypothetical protein [Listeria weihenstephanensis]